MLAVYYNIVKYDVYIIKVLSLLYRVYKLQANKRKGVFMKKRILIATLGAVSAGAVAAYLLSDEEKRDKLLTTIDNVVDKINVLNSSDRPSTIDIAGIPDQTEYIDETLSENADMVSEGSQYGVSYYNQMKEQQDNNSK